MARASVFSAALGRFEVCLLNVDGELLIPSAFRISSRFIRVFGVALLLSWHSNPQISQIGNIGPHLVGRHR